MCVFFNIFMYLYQHNILIRKDVNVPAENPEVYGLQNTNFSTKFKRYFRNIDKNNINGILEFKDEYIE